MKTEGKNWMIRRARVLTLVGSLAMAFAAMLVLPVSSAHATSAAGITGYSARALSARGDAELAAHHPGRAILDYERARLVDPRSASNNAALARARSSLGLPAPDDGRFASALNTLSADEWSWIALGGLALAASAIVGLAWRLRRVPLRTAAVVGAIVAAMAAVGAIKVAPRPGAAVVVGSDVVARVAPFAQADPVFAAAEGSRIAVARTRGKYAWVHGAAGDGWVPADQLETIVVPGARPGA